MFKPFIGICVDCKKKLFIPVKSGRCEKCNYIFKQLKKGLPIKKPTIKKISDRKEKLDALYSIVRANYLKHHPVCEASIPGICSGRPSDQIHHSAGKVGDLYLDDRYFKAVEGNCHRYIEEHPEWAKENGFSVIRLNK